MRKPRIPPMLTDVVQTTLASCDGLLFSSRETCPGCGGDLSGYDLKRRLFAVLKEEEEKKTIHVLVKRFRCRTCNQIVLADQPFYPDTRIGSPVVDLCVTLSETMHFPRVSSSLEEMGIIVDRGSVRNYVRNNRHTIPAVDMFGIRVPVSIVSLSTLAVGIHENNRIDAKDLLAACGYPSRTPDPVRNQSRDNNSNPEPQ